MDSFHHQNIRKRITVGKQKFPHPACFKRFVDRVIYVAAVAGPLMVLPQSYKIWMYKDASSLSLVTWIAFLCLAIVWFTYGVVHREKPIIIAQTCWFIVHLSVIIGVLVYG